jgi:hypothetical protein
MTRGRTYKFALIAMGVAALACAGDGDHAASPTGVSGFGTTQTQQTAPVFRDTTALLARPHGLLSTLLGPKQALPLFVCKNNGGPFTDSAKVGILGGTLRVGPHTLFIPPAALLRSTMIKATTYPGDTIAVTFYPQGLQFIVPATLSLNYSHCAVQPTSPLAIDYLNDLLDELLSIIPSLDKGNGQVTGLISHFSVYAGSETRR